MAPRKRREITAEQKAEAVRLVKKVGNLAQVARDLDLHQNVLRKWVKQAEIDAGQGPAEALTTEEKKEIQRLRRENKKLLYRPTTFGASPQTPDRCGFHGISVDADVSANRG